MTLTLFGLEQPYSKLVSAEPVLSGAHPLHQYHGYLGAQALLWTRNSSCYDPFFQAGYPKTPVFDSGSRPAEAFFLLSGGRFNPGAYKIGLALCCLLVPLILFMAARGFGLGGWGSVAAAALGVLVWWGSPVQATLHAGEIDVLLASLMLIAHTGLLVQFDRAPGVLSWFGLLLTAILGWYCHPLLFVLVLPLFLIWYLGSGVRHHTLLWHLSAWSCPAGALAVNSFWMIGLVRHWWILSPLPPSQDLLMHRTFRTIWEAPLWGEPVDRVLALVLLGGGLIGIVLLSLHKQRTAAHLVVVGGGGLLLLAVLGISLDFWGRIGTTDLLIPALWFAAPAAAYAFVETLKLPFRLTASPWLGGLALVLLIVPGAWLLGPHFEFLAAPYAAAQPLEIGLSPQQQEIVYVLAEQTSKEARILWEDRPASRQTSHWPALLPLLTGRSYIGGLDPSATIEHSQIGFIHSGLAGKPMPAWTDAALVDYCRRYNVGWVLVWSPAAEARLEKWSAAQRIATVKDGEAHLFQIQRPPSFILLGKATVLEAHYRRITLADVEPNSGKVVLSFHYHSNLRASPARVKIEREPNAIDPIPLLRLRVDEPVSRIVLTWDE